MTQEQSEQVQAVTELSEERLDQIAGGNKDDDWPHPRAAGESSDEPLMAK